MTTASRANGATSTASSDPISELINARVWAGIHFRTPDMQVGVLGKKVARYMQNHYFQPID